MRRALVLAYSLSLRDAAAAKLLFRKALTDPSHPQPRVINTGQAHRYGSLVSGVKKEGIRRRCRRHRSGQNLRPQEVVQLKYTLA